MNKKERQTKMFKTLAEFSADWLMYYSSDDIIEYVSPTVTGITGYEAEEFIGSPSLFEEIIHPEDREEVKATFQHESYSRDECNLQFRIIHKNGSVRWISHRCRPVLDEDMQIIGRVSSNQDISSKKAIEAELHHKEQFLQSIFDGIHDPMHVIDQDYRVLLTNKKLLDLRNTNQEEIRGAYCYFAYQGRSTMCEECAAAEVFRTHRAHTLIKTLPLADGNYNYYEVLAFPLSEENGEVSQVVEVTHDITALKRTEKKLETSLQEKEILLKEVHHRVKNNLQIIISMLNLEMEELPQDLSPLIEDLAGRVRVFADIHNNLYQSESVSEVDIRHHLQDTFQRLQRSHGGDPSHFQLEAEISDPRFDLTIAVPLSLLLNELMTQSFTHVLNANGKISISIERHPNGDVAGIEYSDHHHGVPNLKEGFSNTIIQSMADQLGLDYEISNDGAGTYKFFDKTFKLN